MGVYCKTQIIIIFKVVQNTSLITWCITIYLSVFIACLVDIVDE